MKAIIFDLDGTLVDTQQYILQAFNYALKTKGFRNISNKELAEWSGLKMSSIYQEVTALKNVDELIKLHQEFQRNNLQLVTPFDGVQQLLEELQKRKINMTIATSRYRQNTMLLLNLLKWEAFFTAVACGDDAFKEKPDPQMFLWCAKQMNALPQECLVVGDAPRDIEAGKAMKAKTCRAAYGYGGNESGVKADWEISRPLELLQILAKQRI